MKSTRLATFALLCGVLSASAVYSQPPGYSAPPSSPQYPGNQQYSGNQGHYDDGYNNPRVDIGFFYDELSPYGDWVVTVDHGWAWFPRDVNPYWRPYNEGRWVNSEYGWTWVSYEPFGWATYHYGRWMRDPRYGWLWVPGTIWGPAWVSWQSGGGYIGWAPLPPQIGFDIGVGIRLGGFNLSIGIRPDWYSFVPERSFLDPRLSGYRLPTARNVTIIHNTTNITNYTYIDNRVVNRGIDVGRIERATGKKVHAYRVAESQSRQRSEVSKDEIRIYRPDQKKLDTVKAAPKLNAGQRPDRTPRARVEGKPEASHQEAVEVEVAPRVNRAQKPDVKKIDQQAAQEKQKLDRYQAQEKQKIEKLHQQELSQAKAQSDREQIEKRNKAEREALQQEQRESAQQLDERQKAKRQAVEATPPPEKANKAAGPKQEKKKGKPETQKQDKGHGKDAKPEPPPPA